MLEVIRALNKIKVAGVISDYAIGGAIAASFYIEAVNTEDIDAFVFMSAPEGSLLLSLSPIYEALIHLGGVIKKEYIYFGDWPLQILPAYNDLMEEAVIEAQSATFQGEPVRILSPEFLCAVALDTKRLKDFFRVASFIEQHAVSKRKLIRLVEKYELSEQTVRVPNWGDLKNGDNDVDDPKPC